MSKIKVAFIGAGYMASEHLRAFASYSEVKLDGIFSRSRHRTKAIANQMKIKFFGRVSEETQLLDKEVNLVSLLSEYNRVIQESAKRLDPGMIANFVYNLVKEYNQFYHEHSILKETDPKIMHFRLLLSAQVAFTIKSGMDLLGIEVPEIM